MRALCNWRRAGCGTGRRVRERGPRSAHCEALESRVLPAVFTSLADVDLAARANDGSWRVSSLDLTTPPPDGTLAQETLATWNPNAGWRDVRAGDFDGDGQTDIAGREGSNWWVTLANPVGSTTLLAGWWSAATTWSAVAVVDLAAEGDRDAPGHFTQKADVVGMAGDGSWWAAVSNGDGTFRNVLLASWNPSAGWRDPQFLDVNNDGETDIVARARDGSWWAAMNRGGLSFETVHLTSWRESAGWQDVRSAEDFFGEATAGVMARTNGGDWYALVFGATGAVHTRFLGHWNPAAGWRDVLVTPIRGQGAEIVGRTAGGEWWAMNSTGASTRLGSWNEAAGWRDVRAVTLHITTQQGRYFLTDVRGRLLARNAAGEWWMSDYDAQSGSLRQTRLGSWDESAGWRDVFAARVTEPPVRTSVSFQGFPNPSVHTSAFVRGHRAGTVVTVEDITVGDFPGVRVTWSVPSLGVTRTFDVLSPVTRDNPMVQNFSVNFDGHIGSDSFRYDGVLASVSARGLAADDRLDSQNGRDFDTLFGGDGLDVLIADPGDHVEQ